MSTVAITTTTSSILESASQRWRRALPNSHLTTQNTNLGLFDRWVSEFLDDALTQEDSLAQLQEQIIEAYQGALSGLSGLHRAFVLFQREEDSETGELECIFFFFVSKSLYFKIDRLYLETDTVRDFFEDEKNVCISYHFDPYSGQSVEDSVPEEAQEIYVVKNQALSTASEFQDRREESRLF